MTIPTFQIKEFKPEFKFEQPQLQNRLGFTKYVEPAKFTCKINYNDPALVEHPKLEKGSSGRVQLQFKEKHWEFPKERFVIYEPKDELWCRPLGIGKEVVTTRTLALENAVITDVSPDGMVHFVSPGVATYSDWSVEI